ncbi:hypothetical protein CROQUDRAFT_652705 [Cronartium quercuum f. sp. fusiforme G11]|uniref:Uncharacterized protein n=1 Tax=Cronartium quercuum f. sp. fusiforme G11 TaxID=708437 RepID=A0A9P6TFS6_9BASI|nr:hypothetical protein CROQUDRAFT_652705 [Cronartium quercuum f. sp. fusiforme G11]
MHSTLSAHDISPSPPHFMSPALRRPLLPITTHHAVLLSIHLPCQPLSTQQVPWDCKDIVITSVNNS